jgi:hypothetical protein
MQSHGITLSFHREMADSSRELAGPDVTDAVNFESYPRFIKGGFQDYEGLGIKRSTADSKHVPSLRSRLLGNNVFWSLPQKVVESLELTGTSGNLSKSSPSNIAGPQGTGAHAPQFGRAFERETIFQRQRDGERATDAKRQAPVASRAAHGALASSGNYMVGHDGFHAQPASC